MNNFNDTKSIEIVAIQWPNSTQKNLQHSTCKTGHLKLQESYSWIFNHGNNGS